MYQYAAYIYVSARHSNGLLCFAIGELGKEITWYAAYIYIGKAS